MAEKLTLDPVSRIEGHLKMDLDVDQGVVKAAYSSGTSFRGIERVMAGRDPRQAAQITQRICGVCPIPHARCASEAFEAAAGITVSTQALAIRNIIQAANFIDSHVLSVYVLSLPDFISGLPTAGGWPLTAKAVAWAGAALDEENIKQHLVDALHVRQACHQVGATFGGKVPHPVGIVPGGATARVSAQQIEEAIALVKTIQTFVDGPFANDLQIMVSAYPQYLDLGASGVNMLSFGGFPDGQGGKLFPAGVYNAQSQTVTPLDPSQIAESVAWARYQDSVPVHPSQGTTEPDLAKQQAYTLVKAARLGSLPHEVGPLARALVAGRNPGGRGAWARHLARQWEASTLAAKMITWLQSLAPDASAISAPQVPATGSGAGLTEAPRGALGHWLSIEGGKVSRYNVISPTTWNASPRDEGGQPGPLESSLSGVRLADSSDPVEVFRIIHSFDPCLQCAVH